MTFCVHALPADYLSHTRSSAETVALIAEGDEALRCCLRPATAGERLLLFRWEPQLPASPYQEIGPVIAHAESCPGPASLTGYPPGWRGRPQVLRAYDRRGWIHDATRVHDGTDPEGAVAEIFADADVAEIHSRNIAWGCYMFRITRAG